MKYPIGIQDFASIIEGGYTYVDKTRLLYKLVDTGKIYFLSRPRRFGKSLLVSTLKYYFQGRKDLFRGLAIDELEKDWKKYPVFHIDFNGSNFSQPGTLKTKIEDYLSGWEREYDCHTDSTDTGTRFINILKTAHEKSSRRAVVLIDEYDKPILDVLDTGIADTNKDILIDGRPQLLEDAHRDILKGFYSVFKAADQDLQFVLLTGVTKFSQVSVFSGFNQPNDISMTPTYETLCGITEHELYRVFDESIKEMAQCYNCTSDEMKVRLKRRYDGYHFSKGMADVYNPFSLLNAFEHKDIDDYWFRSGTPTYLIRLLSHNNEDLNELTGKYYRTSEFIDYKADVEKPLPMIFQSGYLTIKDCDRDMNIYLLDFPNDEVKSGFVSLVAANYFKSSKSDSWVIEVVRTLRSADLDKLGKLFTAFFADIPYSVRRRADERDAERDFQYSFYLIIRMISVYTVMIEKQQSEGRSDFIIETPDNIYIFEFKLDGTADEALQQIENKGYARPYLADKRRIYKIGASFSSKTGTIDDWKIEEK